MNANHTFETERLPLAIFLHATGQLHFLACKGNGGFKLRFVFADPDGIGAQAEFDYERGATVPATALFASQKFLRRQMTDTMNRKTGAIESCPQTLKAL